MTKSADDAVAKGHLLPEDAKLIIDAAEATENRGNGT
jgi:hypothetical protein